MAKTLVIVAHADDETLGCGGLLYQAGHSAHVAVACQDRRGKSVETKLARACGTLDVISWRVGGYQMAGITDLNIPYFADQALDTVGQLYINRWVEATIDAHPNVRRVFTHWPYDLNRDHRIIAEAVLVATRRLHVNVYAMPIIGTSERGSRPWEPTIWYPLSPEAVDAKLKALAAYGDESTGERSAMIVNAQICVWGALIGVDYAETFHLLRGVGIP